MLDYTRKYMFKVKPVEIKSKNPHNNITVNYTTVYDIDLVKYIAYDQNCWTIYATRPNESRIIPRMRLYKFNTIKFIFPNEITVEIPVGNDKEPERESAFKRLFGVMEKTDLDAPEAEDIMDPIF